MSLYDQCYSDTVDKMHDKKYKDELTLKNWIIIFIKQKRKEKNITQRELSRLSGISRTSIATFETGKQNFTFETIEKIFKALNLSLHAFAKFISEKLDAGK